MSPAPSMILMMSHRYPATAVHGVGVPDGNCSQFVKGTIQMARKPVSSSWLSQPKEYHCCPTLTMEW